MKISSVNIYNKFKNLGKKEFHISWLGKFIILQILAVFFIFLAWLLTVIGFEMWGMLLALIPIAVVGLNILLAILFRNYTFPWVYELAWAKFKKIPNTCVYFLCDKSKILRVGIGEIKHDIKRVVDEKTGFVGKFEGNEFFNFYGMPAIIFITGFGKAPNLDLLPMLANLSEMGIKSKYDLLDFVEESKKKLEVLKSKIALAKARGNEEELKQLEEEKKNIEDTIKKIESHMQHLVVAPMSLEQVSSFFANEDIHLDIAMIDSAVLSGMYMAKTDNYAPLMDVMKLVMPICMMGLVVVLAVVAFKAMHMI